MLPVRMRAPDWFRGAFPSREAANGPPVTAKERMPVSAPDAGTDDSVIGHQRAFSEEAATASSDAFRPLHAVSYRYVVATPSVTIFPLRHLLFTPAGSCAAAPATGLRRRWWCAGRAASRRRWATGAMRVLAPRVLLLQLLLRLAEKSNQPKQSKRKPPRRQQ